MCKAIYWKLVTCLDQFLHEYTVRSKNNSTPKEINLIDSDKWWDIFEGIAVLKGWYSAFQNYLHGIGSRACAKH